MRLFVLDGSEELGNAIATAMGIVPDAHEKRDFEDGEHKARPLVSVRGEDVFVVHALNGDLERSPNDKLIHLLFFLATCRENGAACVTAIVPVLAYARKDRQTKLRDPVTTRYIAQLFEAVGVDRVVTLDVHNLSAFQNAFRCPTLHLNTNMLFAGNIAKRAVAQSIVIFSPDGGGVKRAQLLKDCLEEITGRAIGFGFMEKRRSGSIVSGELFAGDVDGATVFIVDDMISTGGTLLRAATACRTHGAKKVFAYATHALFGENAKAMLADPAFDRIVVTDSVGCARLSRALLSNYVDIIPSAPLFAEAILRLHGGGPFHHLQSNGP